ncbi:hypothetical protein SEVIR_2G206200v4 [Setaria viridis]|uniref:Uncharacterized protein n=2 Tax=Setaria TaxID=4554 RepID=A0A368Q0N2_SETIT|nr:hypothetical protein SETIT_2G198400v2 [Setaria italica]TKW33030.1 hypothetical protein SEVIR_2G206200v2 [Setaria viridis]
MASSFRRTTTCYTLSCSSLELISIQKGCSRSSLLACCTIKMKGGVRGRGAAGAAAALLALLLVAASSVHADAAAAPARRLLGADGATMQPLAAAAPPPPQVSVSKAAGSCGTNDPNISCPPPPPAP